MQKMLKGIRRLLCSLLVLASCLIPLSPVTAEGTALCPVLRCASDTRPALDDPGLLEVHFINVASADCILLRMGGETMLIDSGIYRHHERILRYLAELGIDSLDYALGTHPHDDHIGGFAGILPQIPADVFLKARRYEGYDSENARALEAVLEGQGIPVQYVDSDTTLSFGAATLSFYQWQAPQARENNRSLVIRVSYGDRAILLAADVENNGQRALAETYGTALQADILKMPHHGLAPCIRELHDAVRPSLATVSNIKDKVYDVLRTCEKRGVDWLLTTKGTIVAVTDGGDAWQVWQLPREAA